MTTKFYTNIYQVKSMIHHHFVEDGVRKVQKVRYKPTLGVPADKDTGYKDIYGNNVGVVDFDNIFEMYGWKKENIDYINIYNDIQPMYQFISDEYPDAIEFDSTQLKVANIDIEVYSDEGFPYPSNPIYQVTAICLHDMFKDTFYVFGCGDYTPKEKRVVYIQSKNEAAMLQKFIKFWRRMRPDVITGWNTEAFDIPYLAGRIEMVLGVEEKLKLSPVNEIRKGHTQDGQECLKLTGIQHLDYMQLFKMRKFNIEPMESYSLDFVSNKVLGEGKIEYHEEYGALHELYKKNYELFIDYNIKDTELISLLNKNRHYIELIMTMAYMAKVNFEDCMGSVKIWDVFVYNELKKINVMVSPKQKHPNKRDFPGGHVMEPTPGMKDWLVVFDIASSYPNQIISFNLSPETIIDDTDLPDELYDLKYRMKAIRGFVDLEKIEEFAPLLKKHNVSFTANCEFFTKEKYGIFPQIVGSVFERRIAAKGRAKILYAELQEMKKKLEELKNG